MKRLLLVFMLCLCFLSPTFLNSAESFSYNTKESQSTNFDVVSFDETIQTKNYIVTANKANLYQEANFSSTILTTLNHKTIIKVIFENNNPKQTTKDNFVFYNVKFEEFEGFMFADLITAEQNFLTAIPNFNAQTNSDAKVYFLQDNEIRESNITLKTGERIFLYEGFDNKKEYNAIAFVVTNQDGTRDVMYGYLKSRDISPDGINPLLITCVVLILALLGIIFAWMFMKNKKIKFRKKKTSQ